MSSQLPSLSGAVWIAVTAPGMGFDSTQEVFLTRKCTQALGPRGHLGTAHMSDISYLVSSLSTMTQSGPGFQVSKNRHSPQIPLLASAVWLCSSSQRQDDTLIGSIAQGLRGYLPEAYLQNVQGLSTPSLPAQFILCYMGHSLTLDLGRLTVK